MGDLWVFRDVSVRDERARFTSCVRAVGVIFVHTNLPCTPEFDRRAFTQRLQRPPPYPLKSCFQ
jgi:hypothetical protein